MSVSVVALAICCVIGGVAAPWLLPMISSAVPLPLETANTTVSQPMITLLLIACPLLPFIIMAIFKATVCRRVHAVRHGCVVTITSSQWSLPRTVLPCR